MDHLDEFLTQSSFARRTKQTKRIYLKICFDFFHSIKTSNKFLEIKASEFKQLFQMVDGFDILAAGKKRYRYALKAYSDYFCRDIIANNQIPQLNYDFIFSDRFYQFRDQGYHSESHYLEKSDLFEILRWAKNTQPPFIYFAIVILMTTGCHIEGVLTLTKSNVDFKNRKFIMMDKSRGFGSKIRHYIINKQFLKSLEQFILFIPPTQQLLFPISQQKFNLRLKHWKPFLHSRLFRDALNSIWEDMGVEESIRDILCNRIPNSVNARHYLHKFNDWEKRLKKYDSIDFFEEAGN